MFICEPCVDANDLYNSMIFRSFGPCEICRKQGACFDIPSWLLPNRPILSHEVSFMTEPVVDDK